MLQTLHEVSQMIRHNNSIDTPCEQQCYMKLKSSDDNFQYVELKAIEEEQ